MSNISTSGCGSIEIENGSSGSSSGGGQVQAAACAACKYQRRRCTPECILAPYFPSDQPKVFRNAHRLFGVSNIMKILRKIRPEHMDEAMKSIKYESDIRDRFPVHGCAGVIWQLKEQLHSYQAHLLYVNWLLEWVRRSNSNNNHHHHHHHMLPTNIRFDHQSNNSNAHHIHDIDIGIVDAHDVNVNGNINTFPSTLVSQIQVLNLQSDHNNTIKNTDHYLSPHDDFNHGAGAGAAAAAGKVLDSKFVRLPLYHNINDDYQFQGQADDEMAPTSPHSHPHPHEDEGEDEDEVVEDEEEAPAKEEEEVLLLGDHDMFLGTIVADDRQSHVESLHYLQACESSADSPLKLQKEAAAEAAVQNHELKTAAASFSLIS